MIDVQHRSLRALNIHRFASIQRARAVSQMNALIFSPSRAHTSTSSVKSTFAPRQPTQSGSSRPLPALPFREKQFRRQQIRHAQPAPRHLVFVSRANPSRRRANFVFRRAPIPLLYPFTMVGKNQVGSDCLRETRPHVDAGLHQHLDLIFSARWDPPRRPLPIIACCFGRKIPHGIHCSTSGLSEMITV